MSLNPGTKLGHYEILATVGAGGMGEVYRARDTKLGRDVAIKVLPAAFAEDKERLTRFEREARLLASLNHPNIATLFDLLEHHGTHFLVLEFVPGETLAERIKRSPIPVNEALPLFKQIAGALEAAHEKGIIHRDLKPANIRVTPEEKVKVLDFGLAKAMAGETVVQDLSQSPTLTRDATETGVLLGTAPYMSPEQVRGKTLDERTDIWAFGCCLYEALTGKTAFLGETVSDTIASVLNREPDWGALPETTPATVDSLLRRCLRKDIARRQHDISDVRIEIEEALAEPPKRPPLPSVHEASALRAARYRRTAWILAVLAAAAICIAIWASWQIRRISSPQVLRTSINVTPPEQLVASDLPSVALSPDGSRIVYSAYQEGQPRLFLRELSRDESIAIPGTEGCYGGAFFSPDGNSIGFAAGSKLKKVRLDGVGAVDLWSGGSLRGASWGPDNSIVFAANNAPGLMRVSADGGTPEVLTRADVEQGELLHYWPDVLPDGKSVVFSIVTSGNRDASKIVVQSLLTGERRFLLNASSARYVPTGHLVYTRGDTLYAVSFDIDRLEVTGSGFPVQVGVRTTPDGPGSSDFAFSKTGTLAYVGRSAKKRLLVFVDLEGNVELLSTPALPYRRVRFSPDGKRFALSVESFSAESSGDSLFSIYIYEFAEGRLTHFIPQFKEPSLHSLLDGIQWSPDNRNLAINATVPGSYMNIFLVPVDGSGAAQALTRGLGFQYPDDWSFSGERLIYTDDIDDYGWDIWESPIESRGAPRPLIKAPGTQAQPVLSPDERWLAFTSYESGQAEVYLMPYQGSGGRYQISQGGGTAPVWAPEGREIYYRQGNRMMAVHVTGGLTPAVGKPRVLFQGEYLREGSGNPRRYDLAPDGQRFAMIRSETESVPSRINLVLNWFEELKRLVPTK